MAKHRALKYAIALIALILAPSTIAHADDTLDQLRQQGSSVRSVIPIYSQFVSTAFPPGFKVAFENVRDTQYIQESVLVGEDVNRWTQMITVTGAKDLASRPDLTPKMFLGSIASGYQRACPSTFSAAALFEGKLGEFDAFTAVLSCGAVSTPGGRSSEAALMTAIKGQADFYTVQWAERAAPSETPLEIDTPKWIQRFKALSPIKLCAKVPGQKFPHPSCLES